MQPLHQINTNHTDCEELQNLLLCARWLVHQFENIELYSIAKLFEQALSDSEIWIENMSHQGVIDNESLQDVKEREAKAIYNILIKYASIDDDKVRENILSEMLRLTKTSYN